MASADFLAGMYAAKAVVLEGPDALGWSCGEDYKAQFARRIQGAINGHNAQEGPVLDRDYLVFWHSDERVPAGAAQPGRQVSVVRIEHPPHDAPRGQVLDDFVERALKAGNAVESVQVLGVVELPAAAWSMGHTREVSLGNGRVGVLSCGGKGWLLSA